jgi:MFS family permease
MIQAKYLPWLNWAVATAFALFQFFLQATPGIMGEAWAIDFHLSHVGVSSLSAAFFYMYLLMHIPVGILFDRYGPRLVFCAAAFVLSVGCFLLAHAQTFALAFFARLLMGAGASFGFVGLLLVCNVWFKPKQFALLMGISEMLSMLMTAILINRVTLVMMNYGWRYSMNWCASIAFMIMLLIIIFLKKAPRQERAPLCLAPIPIFSQIKCALCSYAVWLVGLYGFFMFAMVSAFTSLWGVPFLRAQHHLSLHQAAHSVAMVFVGIALGTPAISYCSNKQGKRKPILMLCAVLTCLSMSVVIVSHSSSVPFLSLWLFLSGFFSGSYLLGFAVVKELTPACYRSISLAITNMIFMLGAPVLQILMGFLLHQGLNYNIAMSLIPIGCLVAVVLGSQLTETGCCEQIDMPVSA